MEYLIQFGPLGLFLAAFLAATILPLSSEIVLGSLLVSGLSPSMLVGVATAGNVLGSVVNYGMGYGGSVLFARYKPASEAELNKSLERFRKWGTPSLLLAWVPVIGDPLTVAAGVLKVNLPLFLALVTAGKLARYVAVVYVVGP